MTRTKTFAAFVSVVTVPVSCSCQTAERSAASAVRDSAGVHIVTSMYVRDVAPALHELAPRPSVDIGSRADDPAHQLFRVSDALRLPTGSIVVLDGGSNEVRFFSSRGEHVRTVGRDGAGPGEFRDMSSLTLVHPGSLLVYDRALGRVTVLDVDGALLGSVRLDPTGDAVHPLRLYGLGRGRIAGQLVLLARAYPSDMMPTPRVHWDSVPNLLYGMNGTFGDTIGEFSGMDIYATPRRAGGLLFGRHTSADVHQGELYITDGGDYAYRVYGVDGLRRIVRLRRDRRPLTGGDEAALRAFYMARVDDADRESMERYLAETPRADTKPWVSDLIVDAAGNVWVREYDPRWAAGPGTWSVFASNGSWLGHVILPAGLQVVQIGTDFVLGIWRDEMDVEHVRSYDLPI